MELRTYQHAAIDAVYSHLRDQDTNPCVVIPTGGGKTPVIATICRDAVQIWKGRVLILAHVKELLTQSADKLRQIAPDLSFGIYSAGLGCRQTQAPIIVAGVQSVYRRAKELGHFDLVIVDEAHLIPVDGDGMYRSLLSDLKAINSYLRIIGLTATPFRMSTGMICAPANVLNDVCYEIGVRELIVNGYLSPLKNKSSREKIDTSGVHTRAGEFSPNEIEALMDDEDRVNAACKEIVGQTRERRSVLVFTCGVKHGRHVAQILEDMGQSVATVFGDTLDFERERTLDDFKVGKLKFLVNVNVLTTGFDAPNIDCIAMLRPTLSPGLYYQMVGRGFRLHPGKDDCLILDFGGNIVRHGPVDAIEPKPVNVDSPKGKVCPRCESVVASNYSVCPDCGHVFPDPESTAKQNAKHSIHASDADVLSGEAKVSTYAVLETRYSVHVKRNAPEDAPWSMRVDYLVGWQHWKSEWICVEHTGFARHKAELWWARRSLAPTPASAEAAVELSQAGALRPTKSITVRSESNKDFDSIVGCELGDLPSVPSSNDQDAPAEFECAPANDDIPF